MRILLSSMFVLLIGLQAKAAAVIQAASNIHEGKVIVAVEDTDPDKRVFMQVDSRTGKKESLGFPNDLVSEEISAVLSLPEYVVVVSKSSGEDRKPRVHEYVRNSKIWMAAGELNCLSFKQIEIEKSELRVDCADETKDGRVAGTVKMVLDFTSKAQVKATLPLQQDRQGNISFNLLGGSPGKWESMELFSPKNKKALTAKDLSLSSDAKIKKTIKVKETIGPKE
ncbi:hypothetical protein ACLSU7_07760 [Bdellovibrio sp. HCB185ZH]|uniref:hypothetical protein n=1 Tax=Bdellovibrio sp. HCB185ZH TaxID=3394235 RepID=UPI0039A4279E